MTEQTDQKIKITPELVATAHGNNPQAIEELFGQAYRVLLSYSLRRRFSDPEEFAQLGTIKGYERFDQHRPNIPFLAWLTRVAQNAQIDEYRKSPHLVSLDDESVVHDNNPFSNPSKVAEVRETNTRLASAILALPPRARKIFIAHYVDGESYDHIANRLDIPVNTAKITAFRARAQLRASLQDLAA